jgi:purine-nucleoside phosphorylase
MLQKINETASFLKDKIHNSPNVGIILGTGLGGLVSDIEVAFEISYTDIPHFPTSTVEGHSGKLIFGKLGNQDVVAMQGRFHYYEGYSMEQIVFPVRVMKFLGIKTLILSNASGGMNPDFNIGDIMIINDQINLFPSNPLIGKNEDSLGVRFPDMSIPYCKNLIVKAKTIANENNIPYQEGIYAGLSGPCYETQAEYNYIRILGADAVGMSTVPEVITANHLNIPCFALSVITDLGIQGKITEITHEEVQEAASKAAPIMAKWVDLLLRNIHVKILNTQNDD